ncbi:lamin tail domain-containing protein [Catenulispora sp. NL8]|uniref:Lamin tail domain-containing protein n=1 Tax=Catenulispora pinistramenti TaxID=2705254 RepID=A0ABS5L388_9ACTN|nr:lamin tail domain-containing protein [Catenulispora pinistramenti]MBS2552798.1 lamin tail domain-containing protein [Catenulispora pinistramenti]
MSRTRVLTAAAVSASTIAALLALPAAQATVSNDVVVNEVYGGGGNSGATLKNDFIELRNDGTAPVSLASWSVQYISAAPGAATTWQVTNLSGSIAPGKTYLIAEAAGTGGTADLPAPDATGAINLSGTAGTVALVTSQTALTCKTAADCAAEGSIKDLIGYGTAVIHEGSADAPAASNTTSVARNASGTDTDQNGTDFTAGDPTPTPGGSGTGGGTQPGPLRIHDIQGAGWVSPVNGQAVTNVPGIVTALRTSGSKGFWIQDPTPDANPATSEALFVYTGSAPTVAVGDSVLVSGKAQAYYPLASGDTVATTSNLSVTEIGGPTVTEVSSGNALPAPIVLSAANVPATYAPNLGGANIEGTPVVPTRSVLDFYRSIQGMRVEVDDARVVGPSDTYGEQYVTVKPNEAATYRGGSELLGENQTPSGRLEVVPADGSNPHVNVGDVFTGATVGPLDYSQYGGFLIAASTLGTVQNNHLAPVVAAPDPAKELSVATYNVENLAPSDPAAKFQRLGAGIVTNLATPDIVSVEEVQDNSGATDDGTVAADQTLTKLTAAIAAAGGPHYAWREIDPANDQDGGQPGGNIRTVFLYNPARVKFVDSGPANVDRTTTGTQVVSKHGDPALSLSPGRIDPANPVWTASRKPLVGEFQFRGKDVFVIADHFVAKLGDQSQDGRFQYPAQSSAIQRAGQAQVEHDFVQKLLDVDKKADVVVLGDLNDYQFSPAVNALRTGTSDGTGPSILTDLIGTLPINEQYTYDYEGVSEVLDHILVSKGIKDLSYQVVHVNSEYSDQASDHDPQVVRFKV